jgi:hypothetical protein
MILSGFTCTSLANVPEDCPDTPLLENLRQEGSLRLIVTLAGDFVPETELGETEAEEQRRRIAELQDQLIAELAGTETEVLRRFDGLPLLVLVVDEPALCRLLTSELVQSVEPDDAVPPTG